MVFRKGGFSSFEQPGEIYGGIYIALHPEKGIALADMAPAQPGLAIARLRALLRQTGLAEFAEEQPPIVALALTRGELPNLAARLDEAFAASRPCPIDDPDWIAAAVKALSARFPYLRPVLRLEGGALSLEPVAEIPAGITPRGSTRARSATVAVPRLTRNPTRSRRAENPRPSRAGRLALGGAAAALALTAVALMPRYARDLMSSEAPPSVPPGISAQIASPAPQAPSPVPETAAIAPMKPDLLPPWSPSKPQAAAPKEGAVEDNVVPPAKPIPPARPAKRKEAARPTKTAEKEPASALAPSDIEAGSRTPEQKAKKASKPAQSAAARPERTRRSTEPGAPALDNTITVGGLTYIKGREPHGLESETSALDSTTVPVTDARAVEPPASGGPPSATVSVDTAAGPVRSEAPYSQQ